MRGIIRTSLILLCFLLSIVLTTDFGTRSHRTRSKIPKLDTMKTVMYPLPSPDTTRVIPKTFLWGAALSGFQNEGGGGLTDWDEWPNYKDHPTHHPGFTENDIALAKNIGLNSLRFSIEWARIEPKQGCFNPKAAEHYVNLFRSMQRNGITPFPNFFHTTLPLWVAAKGGWENDSIPDWFVNYVRYMTKRLHPLKIEWWMTINEPTVIITEGYWNGNFPPQKVHAIGAIKHVFRNLIHAHRAAYDAIHSICDRRGHMVKVGIAQYDPYFTPYNPKDESDTLTAGSMELLMPYSFIVAIDDRLDYIGINYYGRSFIKFSVLGGIFYGSPVEFKYPYALPENPKIQMDPEGLYDAIERYRIHKKPILITENGLDDGEDRYRPEYLVSHIAWLQKAVRENIDGPTPILGYFIWTLIDNVEWGFLEASTHFGLAGFDATTGTRFVRPSAIILRSIIKRGGVSSDMIKQYVNPKRRE